MSCSLKKPLKRGKFIHFNIPPFTPICKDTKKYITKCSKYMSNALNVPELNLEFRIAENNKSDFGWCKNIGPKTYRISISEFVIDTPCEEYIIEHEVAHAYVCEYFPEEKSHGNNFTNITNALFKHNKIKKPYVRRWENVELEYNPDLKEYIIYFDNKEKAIVKFFEKKESVFRPDRKLFKHKNTETIYNNIFFEIMTSIATENPDFFKNHIEKELVF